MILPPVSLVSHCYRPHPKDGGKVLFSVCLSVHTSTRGLPHPSSRWGDTPSQVQVGGTPSSWWGYPIPGLDGGYLIPGPGRGDTPSSWQGGTPSSWNGVPHPRSRWGYPGVPPDRTGWGTPATQDWMRSPPGLDVVPLFHPGLDVVTPPPPIRLSSIASTCYVAGGIPLAFKQEDFLVSNVLWIISS